MQEGYRLHLSYHSQLLAKHMQSSLVSESLLVAESSLGAELVTLDMGPLVSLIVDAVPKAADN